MPDPTTEDLLQKAHEARGIRVMANVVASEHQAYKAALQTIAYGERDEDDMRQIARTALED